MDAALVCNLVQEKPWAKVSLWKRIELPFAPREGDKIIFDRCYDGHETAVGLCWFTLDPVDEDLIQVPHWLVYLDEIKVSDLADDVPYLLKRGWLPFDVDAVTRDVIRDVRRRLGFEIPKGLQNGQD